MSFSFSKKKNYTSMGITYLFKILKLKFIGDLTYMLFDLNSSNQYKT
jgi:hypothetical protein